MVKIPSPRPPPPLITKSRAITELPQGREGVHKRNCAPGHSHVHIQTKPWAYQCVPTRPISVIVRLDQQLFAATTCFERILLQNPHPNLYYLFFSQFRRIEETDKSNKTVRDVKRCQIKYSACNKFDTVQRHYSNVYKVFKNDRRSNKQKIPE